MHYLVCIQWKKKEASSLSHEQAKFFSHQTLKSSFEFNDKHANASDMTGIQTLISRQKSIQLVKTHKVQYSSCSNKIDILNCRSCEIVKAQLNKIVLFLFDFHLLIFLLLLIRELYSSKFSGKQVHNKFCIIKVQQYNFKKSKLRQKNCNYTLYYIVILTLNFLIFADLSLLFNPPLPVYSNWDGFGLFSSIIR